MKIISKEIGMHGVCRIAKKREKEPPQTAIPWPNLPTIPPALQDAN